MPHSGQTGVYFDSQNHRLLGTLFLARDDQPKPTAIILHGLPGIEKNYDLAHLLRQHGWNSLIFHYRGCWGSDGRYNFKTIPDDVRAALDYLSTDKQPQIDSENLVLIGHSMGGWAAILAALDEPRVKRVLVYGSVCDPRLLSFTVNEVEAEFTPWLPGLTSEDFLAQWVDLDETYSPIDQVSHLTGPLCIIHGKADNVIPFQHAEMLYLQAREGTQLKLHPEANHSFTWHRDWLQEEVLAWLQT